MSSVQAMHRSDEVPPPLGLLLTNTGSPAAPTAAALRPYLAQFLSDPRIIEWPRWLWLPILHGLVLNTRPRRSARLYQRIWTDAGSPLIAIARRQAEGVHARLAAQTEVLIHVAIGMRYGRPSIPDGLQELRKAGARRILALPLFPQYSATTTASAFDAVFDELKKWRSLPELRTVSRYHDHPGYLAALAGSLRESWAQNGRPARWLFSFHGIPQSYVRAGDPYPDECHRTARRVAEQLELKDGEWQVAFQSRFGPEAWVQPYTNEVLKAWGREKVGSVHVVCPGFSADCLETLDEIEREASQVFTAAGGGEFHYVPALNARPDHLDALTDIALTHLQGWITRPPR